MFAYQDPLSEIFPTTYGQTPSVFLPLPPPPVLTLVPAAVLDDDQDPSPVDPRSWEDIPAQAEPADFISMYEMSLVLAANDDEPQPETHPAHHDADVEAPAVTKAKRTGKRKEIPNRQPFKLNLGIRSSQKMQWLEWVMAHDGFTPTMRNVAFAVANRVNAKTGYAWDTHSNYGASAGCEWQAAKKAIDALVTAGFITFEDTVGGAMHLALNVTFFKRRPVPKRETITTRDARRGKDRRAGGVPPYTGEVYRETPGGVYGHTPSNRKQHTRTETESVENEADPAFASSSPARSHLSFDDGWPVFKTAWPALLDDQWRPAFIGARRNGWSLGQVLAGILHVQAALPDGAEMVNIGRFFGQQMWVTSPDDQPDHHEFLHEQMKSSWPEDDDSEISF